MELKELYKRTLGLFAVSSHDNLGSALMQCVTENNTDKLQAFSDMIGGDLSKDWLQMIYQYYCADRKDKKQDYTPKRLAQFLSRLIGESAETVDMCAGSGALTIQRWIENPDTAFILYEIDENVIPYLLFNMALRNINATVHQADVLQQEIVKTYEVRKGEHFGNVACIKSTV